MNFKASQNCVQACPFMSLTVMVVGRGYKSWVVGVGVGIGISPG